MYGPLPLPILILCVVSFAGYLFKYRKRRLPLSRPPKIKNDYTRVNDIFKSKEGFTTESSQMYVLNPVTANFSSQRQLGTKVWFTIDEGRLYLMINTRRICAAYFEYGSNVENIVKKDLPYEAYITDRETYAGTLYDFFTVTVFYRL